MNNLPATTTNDLTNRDRVAIALGIPDTGTPWMDNMIRKSNRRQAATQILAGMAAQVGHGIQLSSAAIAGMVENSERLANAMLEAVDEEE
ncbi:MAG: hypothetical protein ABI574_04585 [Burkholderiales bacterium]